MKTNLAHEIVNEILAGRATSELEVIARMVPANMSAKSKLRIIEEVYELLTLNPPTFATEPVSVGFVSF